MGKIGFCYVTGKCPAEAVFLLNSHFLIPHTCSDFYSPKQSALLKLLHSGRELKCLLHPPEQHCPEQLWQT